MMVPHSAPQCPNVGAVAYVMTYTFCSLAIVLRSYIA